MASIWRDAVRLVFVDEDNVELDVVMRPDLLPRVGDNVRIRKVPYVVDRVGFDITDHAIDSVWVVCRPV